VKISLRNEHHTASYAYFVNTSPLLAKISVRIQVGSQFRAVL
jgi:hypothetical protein